MDRAHLGVTVGLNLSRAEYKWGCAQVNAKQGRTQVEPKRGHAQVKPKGIQRPTTLQRGLVVQ